MIRRAILLAIPLCACATLQARAQQRQMKPEAPGVVRAWPASGAWLVTLSRSADGVLYCAIGTGHQDIAADDRYVWGLRWRDGEPALFISDKREDALAGDDLRIAVDGAPVGAFSIERRRRVAGMMTVNAGLTRNVARRLLDLMRAGASMTFSTATANYVAPLDGVKPALTNIDACNVEANSLRASPP